MADTIVRIFPTSDQQRPFRRWAGPRGIATLSGNGFAVPAERLAEVPQELLLGARINGQVYMPKPGQVGTDAPPLDEDDEPADPLALLRDGDKLGAQRAILEQLDESPPEPAIPGIPHPRADDVPTTGAPDPDDSP